MKCWKFLLCCAYIIQLHATAEENHRVQIRKPRRTLLEPQRNLSSAHEQLSKSAEHESSSESNISRAVKPHCPTAISLAGNSSHPLTIEWQRTKVGDSVHLPNVCWKSSGQPATRRCLQNGTWQHIRDWTLVECSYCEPMPFQHYYILPGGHRAAMNNSWTRAKVGEFAGLHEICLKPNGLPLVRKCVYNASTNTAAWASVSHWPTIECLRETSEVIVSKQLNTLHGDILDGKRVLSGLNERRAITDSICELFRQPHCRLLPADVFFTSQILKAVAAVARDTDLSQDVVTICGTVMASDSKVLRMSADLNATNALLDTFETYMDALAEALLPPERCATIAPVLAPSGNSQQQQSVEIVDAAHMGVRALLSANVSVFYLNPSCAEISGIAIYAPTAKGKGYLLNRFSKFQYRYVYMHETTAALMQEPELQAATFLPTPLWQYLKADFSKRGQRPLLVLKVYSHDALFVETSLMQTRKPFSKILSISIPGFNAQFPETLPFLLRNEHFGQTSTGANTDGTGCGYWNYDTWVSAGVQTDDSANLLNTPIALCGTRHLTQFSFLLGGSYRQGDPSGDVLIRAAYQRALDIITLVGCSLSLLGLCGIWLTAALFAQWRSQASTKVLLNLCVALTLQMTLFVFVNTDDTSEYLVKRRIYADCVALGALLQYSILVVFSWMLIIAFLQFQRYVTIIGVQRPQHFILKSAVAAWGFPLIPTLLVACIDPESYIPTEYQLRTDTGICYPSGHGLAFGVALPITLIIIANLTIFVYVFYSISHSLNQSLQRSEKQMVVKQIRLSVLLFFLLGLSWIFGIFAFMGAGILFSYFFCLTATMQGFVLFVYFVILDDVPRNAWSQLLSSSKRKADRKKATEMQSMTSSTGVESSSRH